MNKASKIGLLVIFLTTAALANQAVTIPCTGGAQVVVTQGINSTTKAFAAFPSCTITVFDHGTTNKSTIFSDNLTPPTSLGNPFSSSSITGLGQFYAANGRYDVTVSGAGITSPLTYNDIILFDSVQLPTTLCSAVAFASSLSFNVTGCGSFPSLTLTGNVTTSTITGGTNGQTVNMSFCQDATGGRTLAWPASFSNPPTLTPAASKCEQFVFQLYADSLWHNLSIGEYPVNQISSVTGTGNTVVMSSTPSINSPTITGTMGVSRINNTIIVDGSTKYPFTAAGLNQANTDAIAIGSGAVVDARSVPTATFTSEIQVGDNTGSHAVTMLLPPVGTWTFTMTGGTACGIRVFGKSSIIGTAPAGSPLFTLAAGASANLYAVACNDPVSGNYVRMENFGITKPATATVVNGALSLENSQDGTLVRSVNIFHSGGAGFFARGICCASEWSNLVINGQSAAGSAPMVIGDSHAGTAGGVLGVSCINCSIDHPGVGINNVSFFATAFTENVNFYNLYMEPNATDTTTPLMQIPANVHGVNIFGGEASNSAGGSTAYMVDIATWAGPCGCIFSGLKSQTLKLVNDHITGNQISGAANFGQFSLYTSGSSTLGGNLTVSGTGAFSSNVTVTGNATLNGGRFSTNGDGSGLAIQFTASGQAIRGTGSPGDSQFLDLGNVTFRNSNATNGGSATFTGSTIDLEINAPSASAGNDVCYGDATAHAIKCNYNNTSFFQQAQTIGSGTVTTAGTTINAGTSQAQTGITVTGATASDTAACSVNGAYPATWQTGIVPLPPVVTSNTVTVWLSNPTSGNITPAAILIRCTVTR